MKNTWKFNSRNVIFVMTISHLSLQHFDEDYQIHIDDVVIALLSNENLIFKYKMAFSKHVSFMSIVPE